MTHLFLIRHGENTDGLKDSKYQDLGLSPEGIHQAERLRDRLTRTGEIHPDLFISSPETRARQTAEIIAPAFGLPITFDKDVEEWRSDDGSLDPDEFMRQWRAIPEGQKAYYRWVEGGENRAEFTLRVQLTLNRLTQEHAGKTIVVLTHGGFIQVSFRHFFGFGEAGMEAGASQEIRRTSLTHWYIPPESKRWILERSNDYHHLLDPSP